MIETDSSFEYVSVSTSILDLVSFVIMAHTSVVESLRRIQSQLLVSSTRLSLSEEFFSVVQSVENAGENAQEDEEAVPAKKTRKTITWTRVTAIPHVEFFFSEDKERLKPLIQEALSNLCGESVVTRGKLVRFR